MRRAESVGMIMVKVLVGHSASKGVALGLIGFVDVGGGKTFKTLDLKGST